MRHIKSRFLNLLCLVILSASLTACQGEQVGSGLDQNKANHMAAVLNSHGISAAIRKESGGRGNFSVWVERSDRGQAASLIDEKGLLEKSESSLEDLLSNQGILPGSREIEQLKLDRALGIQVEKLLENIPGVVSARVIVRQNFLKENISATVSAVLETEPQRSVDRDEVLSIIERAVPGVDREHIILIG